MKRWLHPNTQLFVVAVNYSPSLRFPAEGGRSCTSMANSVRAVLFDWRGTLFYDERDAEWLRASTASIWPGAFR